jgi:hypothetical protein
MWSVYVLIPVPKEQAVPQQGRQGVPEAGERSKTESLGQGARESRVGTEATVTGQGEFVNAKARVGSPFGRIAVVLALLGIALLAPAGAQAAQTHTFSTSMDEFFTNPQGIGVDQSGGLTDGHIWVSNSGSESCACPFVTIFTSTGEGIAAASPITPFVEPGQIAVDDEGNGYVADSGSGTLYKFSPSGALLWEVNANSFPEVTGFTFVPVAVSVDPSNNNVDVSAYTNDIGEGFLEISGEGNLIRAFSAHAPEGRGMAIGLAGQKYQIQRSAPTYSNAQGIEEFTSNGIFVKRLDDAEATGVAYDAIKNQVVVNHGTYILVFNATTGQQIEKFGTGDLVEGTGIAVVGSTGVVYALDRRHGEGGRVDVFSPAALPDLSTSAPTAVASTSATLHGHVDPAGGGEVTFCEFEYGTTTAYGQTAPCAPGLPYASPTDVSAGLTGLAPATEYHYRLSAGNASGSLHQEGDGTFITGPGAPQLLSETVGELGADNARINSTIKVMGTDAKVTVEYGTTTSYGNSAPAGGKVSLAAGPTDQEARQVSVQLLGLTPNTSYHYRVIVSNSIETVVGVDQAFHTASLAENVLADGRGYELVTPVNKHAHTIPHEYGIATDNGEAVLYPAGVQIGDTASGFQGFGVSRRAGGAWASDSPYLRANEVSVGNYALGLWPGSDLSNIAFSGKNFTPGWGGGGLFISNRTGTVRASAGQLEPPVRRPGGNFNEEFHEFFTAGASPDLSTLYFAYSGALLNADSVRFPTLATQQAGGFYEFKNGQLLPADVLPDGTLDPEGAVPAAMANTVDPILDFWRRPNELLNQVSKDGSRAFFVSPDPQAKSPRPVELYVHREGQASLLVSRSELTGEAAATGAAAMPSAAANRQLDASADNAAAFRFSYASASPNGSHVFFESKDQLTADAPADTSVKGYLFDVDTQQLSYLPGVTGAVLDVSNDGSRLFFAQGEEFFSGSELSLWEAGSGVSAISSIVPSGPEQTGRIQTAAATPDGSLLIFTPGSPLPGFNNGGMRQVYRYDTAEHQVECLSCPPVGAAATGPSFLAGENSLEATNGSTADMKAPHYYADGGRRVFFETPQALAVNDSNSAMDVYEWEDGAVHLISDGRNPNGGFLVDNSASGDDVFFVTSEGLDPRDGDGGDDVYDARVGGGSDAVAGTTACGSSCQGEPLSAPSTPNVASIGFEGREGAAKRGKPRLSVKRGSMSGTSFSLAVKAPSGGRIVASGRGVTKVSRSVSKAGTYTLTLTLDSRAREKLKQKGSLTVRVRIVITPTDGKPSTTSVPVTLKA